MAPALGPLRLCVLKSAHVASQSAIASRKTQSPYKFLHVSTFELPFLPLWYSPVTRCLTRAFSRLPYVQSHEEFGTVSGLDGILSRHHSVWQTAVQKGKSGHCFQISSYFKSYFLGPPLPSSSSDLCLELGQMWRWHLRFWWQLLRVAGLISVGSLCDRALRIKRILLLPQMSWKSKLSYTDVTLI